MTDEERRALEARMGQLCLGWLNNRMFPILALMELIGEKDQQILMRARFFLEDIEHHFMRTDAPAPVRNAFCYLQHYLRVYPDVSIEHSRVAVSMIRQIYEALDLKLDHADVEPRLSVGEKLRRMFSEEKAQKSPLQEFVCVKKE